MTGQEATVTAAAIAATASVLTLLLNTRLSEGRDKRRILWEREQRRFFEIEEVAGELVEALLGSRWRSEKEKIAVEEKLEYIHAAAGRFLRYKKVSVALGELHHTAALYYTEYMQHETAQEFKDAKNKLVEAHQKLLQESDGVLGRVPWWRELF